MTADFSERYALLAVPTICLAAALAFATLPVPAQRAPVSPHIAPPTPSAPPLTPEKPAPQPPARTARQT
jgi:hypothetical protein